MQNDREEPLFSELDNDDLKTLHKAPAVDESVGGRSKSILVLAVIVLLVIGGIAYFSNLGPGESPPAPPPMVAVAPEPAPTPAPAPDIPVSAPVPSPKPEADTEPELATTPAPPLALADSDPPVRASLEAAGSADMYTTLLANSDLIQRGTGVIDGLSRGLVLNKILPLPAPTGKFKTLELSGQTVLDPAGYSRYDDHAKMVEGLDTTQLVATFHSFRPLLEAAYSQLGYKGEDFDNTLIRALDEILATPEIHGEIALKKKEAVYLFADPELEALSPLQKQLVRMGPDNIALIKTQAKALRAGLLAN